MNNNITEDYCSFEVSKLLKEKGFAVMVNDYFSDNGATTEYRSYKANYNSSVEVGQKCSRPTHTLAIKWIRENFGIHIWVQYASGEWFPFIRQIHEAVKTELDSCNSPEEATEAALKYTLNNLI